MKKFIYTVLVIYISLFLLTPFSKLDYVYAKTFWGSNEDAFQPDWDIRVKNITPNELLLDQDTKDAIKIENGKLVLPDNLRVSVNLEWEALTEDDITDVSPNYYLDTAPGFFNFNETRLWYSAYITFTVVINNQQYSLELDSPLNLEDSIINWKKAAALSPFPPDDNDWTNQEWWIDVDASDIPSVDISDLDDDPMFQATFTVRGTEVAPLSNAWIIFGNRSCWGPWLASWPCDTVAEGNVTSDEIYNVLEDEEDEVSSPDIDLSLESDDTNDITISFAHDDDPEKLFDQYVLEYNDTISSTGLIELESWTETEIEDQMQAVLDEDILTWRTVPEEGDEPEYKEARIVFNLQASSGGDNFTPSPNNKIISPTIKTITLYDNDGDGIADEQSIDDSDDRAGRDPGTGNYGPEDNPCDMDAWDWLGVAVSGGAYAWVKILCNVSYYILNALVGFMGWIADIMLSAADL
ncbi:hypothetical protein ACFL14_00310 [Patescibacteria group bacterium]